MLRQGMWKGAKLCRSAVASMSSQAMRQRPAAQLLRREWPRVWQACASTRPCSTAASDERDTLFSSIDLELRGHDNSVLDSYITFVQSTCGHLEVEVGAAETLPTIKWLQNVLKSKHVHKKHKVQYETRTNVRRVQLNRLTGSTASSLLEYVQRNLPEAEPDPHPPERIAISKTAIPNRISRLCNASGEPHENLVTVIRDLQISVNLTTESFLTADKPAISGSSTTSLNSRHNRDAATLFTARRIGEDLILSTLPEDRSLVRSVAYGRRLSGLCRLLADRLTNIDVDHLPNVHFFAHSLHEMIVRFDEHLTCLLTDFGSYEELRHLRRAIDRFRSVVVVQLQAFVNEWRVLQQQMIAKCMSDQQKPPSTTASVRYIHSEFKPKGYLLPIPLREKRRIVQQNLVNRRPVVHNREMPDREKKRKQQEHRHVDSLMTTVDRIESRWKELLNSEIQQVLLNSTQQTAPTAQKAHIPHKDAETNTSDWHNSWLRSARDPANRLTQKIIENAVNHIIQDIDDACDQIVENVYAEEIGRR
uniref:Small ribosomal subunit protein uS10m n=1 Tax=Plectus sambesii TaxID=2011161 RepID=A0A914W280_9BILA